MQGQSSANGSLTGSSNFDQGSQLSEQGIDQQIYWNYVRNSAPDRLLEYVPSSCISGPFDLQSSEHVEGSDGGPRSSMEGRRLSRKRIATEENVGQSSGSGSSNFFQHAESSAWRAIPAPRNTGNSLTIPAPSENTAEVNQPEQVNPRLGLGVGGVSSERFPAINVAGNTEISHRNLRLHINSSQQQDSLPSNLLTVGTAAGSSSISAPCQESGLLPGGNSLSPEVADSNPQFQSLLDHVPAMHRNLQSSRRTRSSSSRAGSTSNSAIEGNAAAPGGSSSRIIPRNRSEHPILRVPSRRRGPPPRWRGSVQSTNDLNVSGGNNGVSGNDASFSLGGSAAGSHQGSGHNWFPDRNSPLYPRSVSGLVRRSLLSSSGPDSGGQSINISPPHSHTSDSDQVMPLPPEDQERHLSHSRSALEMMLDRYVHSASGLSHSLRTLAAASEGRSRPISEDLMILDQSDSFGMGDPQGRNMDGLDLYSIVHQASLYFEERRRNLDTGVSEEIISSHLKQNKYTVSATTDSQESEPCCICLDEYTTGDELGELKCGHGFHAKCIKQWLMRKNSCPLCKKTAMCSKEKA